MHHPSAPQDSLLCVFTTDVLILPSQEHHVITAYMSLRSQTRCNKCIRYKTNLSQLLSIPEAVCGEAGVELEGALLPEGLHSTVNGALVGVAAICQLIHLLNAGLHKVEGQTACCGTESSNQGSAQDHCLAILGKPSLLKQLLGLQQAENIRNLAKFRYVDKSLSGHQ